MNGELSCSKCRDIYVPKKFVKTLTLYRGWYKLLLQQQNTNFGVIGFIHNTGFGLLALSPLMARCSLPGPACDQLRFGCT